MVDRRVLVVEPFLHGSHEAWAEGWRAASRHEIHIIGLGGRQWRRGMRAGAAILAPAVDAWVRANGRPDVVVGTNMLDLAGFLGLARRSLGDTPAVQFMHENQLSYPRQPGEPLDQGLAWMQWRGLIAADEVWCNSEHHRAALLDGLANLDLRDDSPVVPASIAAKCWVAHLGIDVAACARRVSESSARRPLIVSNQRWHHDKDLGSVLRALRTARDRGLSFEVALLGDASGGEAEALAPLIDDLGEAVVVSGHLDRAAYLATLQRADVVVSAARNENFGLAIAEAVAAGAWPVLPDGLAYPEVIPASFHGLCLYKEGDLGGLLRSTIERVGAGESAPVALAESMRRFDWSVIASALDDRIDHLLAGHHRV